MFDLTGKTALVTGASGGLGQEIAAALHNRGASVVLTGTRVDALSAVAEKLGERAHVGAARGLLTGGGPVGRKLDFLSQEFNREANTLCSKSSDTDLTQIGLDLKAVIDQVKEQSANLE